MANTDDHMTERDLDEILRRCDGATGGPWTAFVEGRDHTAGSSFIRTAADDIELSGATTTDYDFIASAKQDVPRLVAEVRRLRAQLECAEPARTATPQPDERGAEDLVASPRGSIAFGQCDWHDAVLLAVEIDRREPGARDEVVITVEWPSGTRSRIRFAECLAISARMNFGYAGPDSIRGAWSSDDTPLLASERSAWTSMGGDASDVRSYTIETSTTGCVIEICARFVSLENGDRPGVLAAARVTS